MKFSTLLLTGASIAALSSAPAFARGAPDIHLATRHAKLVKTHISDPKATNVTRTYTFSSTISTAADYGVKTSILGDTWLSHTSSGNCAFPPKESWKGLPMKSKYAKLSQTVMTGSYSGCPGGNVTPFREILYKLLAKKVAIGKSDVVAATLTAKHWTLPNGAEYNLYLKATVNVSITS